MMRAVWYDRQGPANEVIVYGELPTPEPGTGEVRVRLEASGVNPSDTYRRRGPVPAMEYPRVIPNSDGAGVIDKVGADGARALGRQARLALQRPAQRPLDGHRRRIHRAQRRSGDRTAGRMCRSPRAPRSACPA